MKRFIGFFLLAIAGGLVAFGLIRAFETRPGTFIPGGDAPLPVHPAGLISEYQGLPDFEAAAAISVHAVVHIKTEFQRKSSVYDDFFGLFSPFGFQDPDSYRYSGAGSGVIIRPDGYIVTNNHVVQDANAIEVTMNDKRTYQARVIGLDPSTDIALIKIDEEGLPYLLFGNSDQVKVGEWVLAVGNPFNLTSTVTAGIVSAKARNINILGSSQAIESFIQTDAAVNPGNSGGALVNTEGELIGINAAIASGTGSYVGYSFAIPANIVKKVVEDYINFGEIQRAYMGIYYTELDGKVSEQKGLKDVRGVYVEQIVPGGAAEDAGISEGDIIVKLNDSEITTKSELQEFVGQHNPGDKVLVQLHRNGQSITKELTLKGESSGSKMVDSDRMIILGATIESLTAQEKSKYRMNNGFIIRTLETGKLKQAGIRVSFIITAIDNKPVNSLGDIQNALTSKKGGVLIQGRYPNGIEAFYGLGL